MRKAYRQYEGQKNFGWRITNFTISKSFLKKFSIIFKFLQIVFLKFFAFIRMNFFTDFQIFSLEWKNLNEN